MNRCYGCGEPIRRGFPMITQDGEEVIICERCMRLWKKQRLNMTVSREVNDGRIYHI